MTQGRFARLARVLPTLLLSLALATSAHAQLAGLIDGLATKAIDAALENAAGTAAGKTAGNAAGKAADGAATAAAEALEGATAAALLHQHAALALAAGATFVAGAPYLEIGTDGVYHLFVRQMDQTVAEVAGRSLAEVAALVKLAPQRPLIVARGNLWAAGPELQAVARERPVWSFVDDGTVRQIHFRATPDGIRPSVVIGDGLELALGPGGVTEAERLMARAVDTGEMAVYSLFDRSDGDVLQRLDDAIGSRHVRYAGKAADDFMREVFSTPGRPRLVVGHVEDGFLVVRDARNEEVVRVAIAALEQRAHEARSTLLVLGCGTGGVARGGGPVNEITDVWLAARLKAAMAATTAGGFLGALADAANPLLLHSATIDGLAVDVHLTPASGVLVSAAGGTAITQVSGALFTAAPVVAASPTPPGAPAVLALLVIGALVSFRRVRAHWQALAGAPLAAKAWLALGTLAFLVAFALAVIVTGAVFLLFLGAFQPTRGLAFMKTRLAQVGDAVERLTLRLRDWALRHCARVQLTTMGGCGAVLLVVVVLPLRYLIEGR